MKNKWLTYITQDPCMVHLPANLVIFMVNVGKYTRPMGPMLWVLAILDICPEFQKVSKPLLQPRRLKALLYIFWSPWP